jgi:ribosomal protein S18 acetylase RimI-like enzyme
MKVRLYTPNDLEDLIAIIKAHLHADVVLHIGPWNRSEAMLREAIPSCAKNIEVMERSGEIVAFVWAQVYKEHMQLEEIHVVTSARGQGLGQALLKRVEKTALAHGVDEVRLAVFQSSDAVGFYRAFGFEVRQEREHHQFLMAKKLNRRP